MLAERIISWAVRLVKKFPPYAFISQWVNGNVSDATFGLSVPAPPYFHAPMNNFLINVTDRIKQGLTSKVPFPATV
jgi:hypothetical protein